MTEQVTSKPRRSLRMRLLALLLASVSGAWLVTAALSYFDARKELGKLLDAHLAQSAAMLLTQRRGAPEETGMEHAPVLHRYTVKVAFQIWEKGKILRLHSANAPDERLSQEEEGFSDVVIGEKRWRVFSAWTDDRTVLVQVAEEHYLRNEIVEDIAEHMLLPLLVTLPLLGALVWLMVTGAVRPLKRLGEDLARRAPGNLSPIDSVDAPAEISPLVDSLNFLFARVRDLMESERRFTADAAHELRTPLAGLRAQAQVAQGAANDEARRHALDQVITGCDRAARLVEQLLTLARLEPAELKERREPCDLAQVARDAVADAAPFALSRGVEIELDAPAPLSVPGTPELLRILTRNLIDNAVRYSPAQTFVGVAVSSGAGTLTVQDRGPGVPADERAKLGQRFHRVLGTGETGSGLGLSIVKRIAELHDARVEFGEGEGGTGLRVTVTFPGSAAAARIAQRAGRTP